MHKEQRLTQTIRYLQTIETNLDIYKIDHGQYPSQKAGLNALVGKYIRYLKKDSWGNSFIYETSAEDRKPLIRSVGPDGIDDSGTRDDVISTEKVYECEYFGSCTSIGEVIVIFLVPLTAILIITLALLLMAEIIPTIYFFSYSYLTKRKDKKVE